MAEESNHKLSADHCGRFIPPEIVFDILRRLPVKSVCRFKCVSTLWRSIISDRGFVSSYSSHSRSHPKLLISPPRGHCEISGDIWLHLCDINSISSGLGLCLGRQEDSSPSSCAQVDRQAPHQFRISTERGCNISRSVSGLVSHDFRSDRIVICSPSTGQCITLPPNGKEPYWYDWTNCLCFDPVTNQHKVLHSTNVLCSEVCRKNYLVIGLSDRRWRRIRDDPLELLKRSLYRDNWCSYRLHRDDVCVNGVLYFTISVKLTGNFHLFQHVVKFCVHSERFEIVPVDLSRRHDYLYKWQSKLVELLNGRVAIVDYPKFEHNESEMHYRHFPSARVMGESIHLWFLDDLNDVEDLLPKHPSVTAVLPPNLPRAGRFSLAGSVHAGEVLVFISTVNSESSCLFYNAKSNVFTNLAKIDIPIDRNPRYSPAVDQLSVSDHEENLLVLENFGKIAAHIH